MKNKDKTKETNWVPSEVIENKIFFIRGKKVMLDSDLAELYGVKTKVLNQSAKRNRKRFPEDFMFQLSKTEATQWQSQFSRSQIVTLKRGQNIKYAPYVFTEQGVLMLSNILKSKIAIQTSIQIVRVFIKLREMVISNKELRQRVDKLEKKYDKQLKIVFDSVRCLLEVENKPKNKIGFKTGK